MATLDHFFIFSAKNGAEADLLTKFGLTEGRSNQHPGQGTACRRFFFENCFLELVWVENVSEIKSNLVAPTHLWERADPTNQAFSPFGVCVQEEENQPTLFSNGILYAPPYLPEGIGFEMITHEMHPEFPMLFKMPHMLVNSRPKALPTHPIGFKRVTKLIYRLPMVKQTPADMQQLKQESWFSIEEGGSFRLTVVFDSQQHHKAKSFEPDLPLVFLY